MNDYRRVLAIDAGTRNFAYCLVDTQRWREPIVWQKEDLWVPLPGRATKPNQQDMVQITYEWCERNKRLFENIDLVVLEAQIRKPFIIMNTVLQVFCYRVCKVVHPMTVATFFSMPSTRENKKKRGVEIAQTFCAALVDHHGKLDDMADAWLMACWGLVQTGGLSKKEFFL